MASRPSIVFLFDLELASSARSSTRKNELCVETDTETDSPTSFVLLLRHVSLSILNHFSEKQANIQWGYRFYSSSNYQLTNKARFVDLAAQTIDEFEEALNIRFEQRAPESCLNHMSGAGVLSRTLQDIISDYEWKTPSDSLTPTRKGKKTGKQLLDHNLQNLVFIFTKVPGDQQLASFCRLDQQPTLKVVSDAVLPKELSRRFQDLQISLNFIDLSSSQKTVFSKIVGSLKGAVINFAALTASPFSFSQILQASCNVEESPEAECKSCKDLQLCNKMPFLICGNQIELQVQCWNPACNQLSLSYTDTRLNTPVVKCVAVPQKSFRMREILLHKSLYLVSSQLHFFQNLAPSRIAWVGSWNERLCCICPLSPQTGAMFFPSPEFRSFQHWTNLLAGSDLPLKQQAAPAVSDFVARLWSNNRDSSHRVPATPLVNASGWRPLISLRGNYGDKKRIHSGSHWEMLKNCFHKEEPVTEQSKESKNNCFDDLARPVVSQDSLSIHEVAPKKIGSGRIQNLRASTLLQKSQEVRARNDRMEQEKDDKEKQMANERKEKMWKEQLAYMDSIRPSIFTEENWLRLVGESPGPCCKEDILERCLQLKDTNLSAQLEDWQWMCLVQVVVSAILYMWQEPLSMEPGYKTVTKHFLKKPGIVSRATAKDRKVNELKFQIILRLELAWTLPSMTELEEDVIQETATLFQLLSLHSSPKVMSSFYQDALIPSYEGMLPDFLVFLGEELNLKIPANLSDEVSSRKSKSPSPAPSSKNHSVQSVASQQEVLDSQRPAARDLRSRNLSRQPSLNLMQHKKQITLPNRVAEKASAVVKKEDPTEVGRVRRSLQFGAETPNQKIRTKSPAKSATPRRLDDSFQAVLELTTPCKTNDVILAPETPSRLRSGGKSTRKTDGVHVVGESPEVKLEGLRRSPRRLQAANALRRRASFYSSMNSDINPEKGASRNWARAESQVWSDKAKANVNIQAPSDDCNSSQVGQPAHFLFSRIISRNDSSPRKSDLESETLAVMPTLSTPLKADLAMPRAPNTPSLNMLSVPDHPVGLHLAPGTPLKTPMKTPKQVQFNLSFQPATPSSKMVPATRSILKSPFKSPCHGRTPRKVEQEGQESQTLHVLDENNLKGRHQLELSSPIKVENEEENHDVTMNGRHASNHLGKNTASDVVHKLDDQTLRPDEEVDLSPGRMLKIPSPISLTLRRRSPRKSPVFQSNPTANFFQRNPNWSVVDYRRPLVDGRVPQNPSRSATNNTPTVEDPYAFDDELETLASRPDASSHKRKLFQTSAEKPPSTKRRRLVPSPISESNATPTRFQVPKDSSLFHLENSPIVSSIEAKFSA